MALITNASLNAMRVAFNKVFEQGKVRAQPQYLQVATVVPSTTKSNTYGCVTRVQPTFIWGIAFRKED